MPLFSSFMFICLPGANKAWVCIRCTNSSSSGKAMQIKKNPFICYNFHLVYVASSWIYAPTKSRRSATNVPPPVLCFIFPFFKLCKIRFNCWGSGQLLKLRQISNPRFILSTSTTTAADERSFVRLNNLWMAFVCHTKPMALIIPFGSLQCIISWMDRWKVKLSH